MGGGNCDSTLASDSLSFGIAKFKIGKNNERAGAKAKKASGTV